MLLFSSGNCPYYTHYLCSTNENKTLHLLSALPGTVSRTSEHERNNVIIHFDIPLLSLSLVFFFSFAKTEICPRIC